jgi:deoxyribonucleoside regulator
VNKYTRGEDREELLADIAEMYYVKEISQVDIARAVGVTRSAVSRMLKEAKEKGIIELRIRHPLQFDETLARSLEQRFVLRNAYVLAREKESDYDELRARLGKAAAQVLTGLLAPQGALGVAWGTTVNATIAAFEVKERIPVKVVQLVGVLGSSSHASNAHALVQTLAGKLGGEGVYMYTPLIVDSEDIARSLRNSENVRSTIEAGKHCDVALLGIGTTDSDYCALFQGGHISRGTLEALRRAGAVGDVSAHFYGLDGRATETDFHSRLIGIGLDDLLAIPTRLGVAGGRAKARAILGALRGHYINVLITDSPTAALVLELDQPASLTSRDFHEPGNP